MGVPLRVIPKPPAAYRECEPPVGPGDMWRDEAMDTEDRESWLVMLPNGSVWYTTQTASDGGRWDVTGVPPRITVSPSIFDHWPGNEWHGWIRDGELVDA
jgi:Family of unknown function (DUF6527)